MKNKILSLNPVRILVIAALVIPLALGAISPASASLADNSLSGWGSNVYNASSPPVGLSGVIAIAAAGYHSVALKNDGTVWGWGWNNYGQVGDGTTNIRLTPVPASGLRWKRPLRSFNSSPITSWRRSRVTTANAPNCMNA